MLFSLSSSCPTTPGTCTCTCPRYTPSCSSPDRDDDSSCSCCCCCCCCCCCLRGDERVLATRSVTSLCSDCNSEDFSASCSCATLAVHVAAISSSCSFEYFSCSCWDPFCSLAVFESDRNSISVFSCWYFNSVSAMICSNFARLLVYSLSLDSATDSAACCASSVVFISANWPLNETHCCSAVRCFSSESDSCCFSSFLRSWAISRSFAIIWTESPLAAMLLSARCSASSRVETRSSLLFSSSLTSKCPRFKSDNSSASESCAACRSRSLSCVELTSASAASAAVFHSSSRH
mmetsp:Transcript_18767/g.31614  ORF Transcript_18767/g.31614 Transcript_18767/m.31614 type:complete len:292 (-) Transcript_18767:2099-2974(-)